MSAPRSALFIAYHYPPRGGVAVLRTVKFLKYLSRWGWDLDVVTLKTRRYPVVDETMGKEVPDSVGIYRLPDPGTQISRAARVLSRRRRSLKGFPDLEAWWVPMAAATAIQHVVRKRVPVIYTTSPPHSTHLVGEWCKRVTGVRWVADFRDTWVANPYFMSEEDGWRREWKERLERGVISQADVVLANTPHARDEMQSRYPEYPDKFVWLPNGFDAEDFSEATDARSEPKPLTLMYVGSMGHTRPMDYFLAALERLKQERVPGADNLEVVLVGPASAGMKRDVASMGLGDQVRFTGHLPHGEAVRQMHSSDVLLLLQFADHGGRTALPSKVFEYMRAKKVILGMACEGPTHDLIRDYSAGIVTPPDDVTAICGALTKLLDMHRRGALPVVGDDQDIDRFSRERLAGQLNDIMTGLLTSDGQSENAMPQPAAIQPDDRVQT